MTTDEEMAEESLISYRKEPKWAGKMFMQDENTCYKDGFLAGLKAGRPQWHDLRKDPDDLPRQGVELLVSVDGYTRTAMYSKETNSFTCQEGVIAWMYEPEFI